MTTLPDQCPLEVRVRRIHRRDVNRETVEYQRPRSKARFCDIYDEEGTEQLLFETDGQIVGYAECTFEVDGKGSWLNPRYFEKREMRPIFVEELAVHPGYQGKGVGNFILEQIHHLARLRGCTHVVLEVAENNTDALRWYRKRSFYKLDAAIFMAQKVATEPDLLPPRRLREKKARAEILAGSERRKGESQKAAPKGRKGGSA